MSTQNRHHSMQAFGLAILIEGAIVAAALIALVYTASVKPALSEPVPITLVADEVPLEPKPVPPPPVPQPKLKTPVKPVLPTPEPPPVTPDPIPVATVPTAFTEPVPAPVPPPPEPSGKIDPSVTYAAQVHAAVQAAYSYPPSAAAMHFSGRVRAEFHLRDGVVGESRVLQSCGIGIFDRAALQAIHAGFYPEPPAELRGRDILYQVWVDLTTH